MTTCRQILNFVDFIFFSESKCPIKKVNQMSFTPDMHGDSAEVLSCIIFLLKVTPEI